MPPYGYRIVDGQAVIHEKEASRLKSYFRHYLEGDSMAGAARAAGITLGSTACGHFLVNKTYAGTDFYPAIITQEYQEQLVQEWNRRKQERPARDGGRHACKTVPVYTTFRLAVVTKEDSMTNAVSVTNNQPADRIIANAARTAAALYDRIGPQIMPQHDGKEIETKTHR